MTMHLLAIETSTEACSVALVSGQTIVQRHELAPRRHAELVLPMVEQVLAEAGLARGALDAIAVGRGPGAFTGVRLAISIAQGLALGLDRPVVTISTLAALALEARYAHDDSSVANSQLRIIAALDARMGEIYVATFECDADDLVTAVSDEQVLAAAALAVPATHDYIAAGTGWGAYREALLARLARAPLSLHPDLLPTATSIARLALRELARGNAADAAHAQPVYLRDKVALTVSEQAESRRTK